MKYTMYLMLCFLAVAGKAQSPLTYQNESGETHLAGPVSIADLRSEPFRSWFDESYAQMSVPEELPKWRKQLKNVQVDIYMGTWCGDSKRWVPRLIKLWEALGLHPKDLTICALYGGEDRYKQGPNGEERGKKIHRVPTFIFKKAGAECARIVESPVTDLQRDLAQIALGYPPEPNYRAAQYLMDTFEKASTQEIMDAGEEHIDVVGGLVGSPSELNTLGYVYLRSGRIEEALATFQLNTLCYGYVPSMHYHYARALEKAGNLEKAILAYEKVLASDYREKEAQDRLTALKEL